jgi:hypothetical protein
MQLKYSHALDNFDMTLVWVRILARASPGIGGPCAKCRTRPLNIKKYSIELVIFSIYACLLNAECAPFVIELLVFVSYTFSAPHSYILILVADIGH